MKKLRTKIVHNGVEKEIAVLLDDETARLLEEYGNETLRHKYIVEEYKAQLIERRETRRHQSLEKSMAAGFDIIDESTDIEEATLKKIDAEKLRQALQILEPQQKWLLEQIFVKGKSKVQIANDLGVGKTAISNRLQKIYRKIKKFLI